MKLLGLFRSYFLTSIFLVFYLAGNVTGQTATTDNDSVVRFIGGDSAFFELFKEKIYYPDYAKVNCIHGRVIFRVFVDTSGHLDSFRLMKSVHPMLDREAARFIITTEHKWQVPRERGVKKPVWLTIPIMFKLDDPDCPKGEYIPPDHYYNIGINLYNEGKLDGAFKYFQTVVNLDETDADAWYIMAAICIGKNKFKEGCQYLNRVKRLNKRNVDDLINKYCGK